MTPLDRWRKAVQRNDELKEQTRMEIRSNDGTVIAVVTTPALPANDPGLAWAVEQTLRDAANWCEIIIRDPGPAPDDD